MTSKGVKDKQSAQHEPPANASGSGYRPVQVEVSPARRQQARGEVLDMIEAMGLSEAPPEEVAKRVSKRTFREYGAYSTLQHIYAGSPYAALRDIYPQLHPWQMKHVPMSYWMGPEGREHAQEATRWMLGRLGLVQATPKQLAEQVDFYTFVQHGLRGMLDRVYQGSPYAALRDVVPGLEPWERGNVPRDHWREDEERQSARSATRNMLEVERLWGKPPEAVAKQVDQAMFARNGLSGMLSNVYSNSPYAALRDIYPELRPWQMSRVPLGYWRGPEGRAHAVEAMTWLAEQIDIKPGASVEEITPKLSRVAFEQAGLGGMLQTVYHAHLPSAIKDLVSALDKPNE